MCGMILLLFAIVGVCTLIYPPSAAITVPLCSLIWIVYYLNRLK